MSINFGAPIAEESPEEQLSYAQLICVYLGYAVLLLFGHVRDALNRVLGVSYVKLKKGYPPLLDKSTYFYTVWLYRRISDCWNRPIASCPGAFFDLVERTSSDNNYTLQATGKTKRVINLGSYNYLGYAENSGPVIEQVVDSLKRFGTSVCSTAMEAGRTTVHDELERCVARFVGKEAAMVFGMGYATNSSTLPALLAKGSLVISDSNNHASLVVGCRTSNAAVRVFKHNDPRDLERVVRRAIVEGQPRTHRPWKKIIILVEGIYSMEGEVLLLPEVIAVKKKYKCYLYVDEAHSIGALGEHGRGVVEYWNADPGDVDILMGTFTKSFGAVGGYIAANKNVIAKLKQESLGCLYAISMAVPCAMQALAALRNMEAPNGLARIKQLHDNANYFRDQLSARGFQVYGDPDSPVVPLMLYHPPKIAAFSRLLLERGIAVVVVGFPATPLILSRCRFCISASHAREDLDEVIEHISEVGDVMMLKYVKGREAWRKSAK